MQGKLPTRRPNVDLRKMFPEVLRNGAKGTYLFKVPRDPRNVHSHECSSGGCGRHIAAAAADSDMSLYAEDGVRC
jgi:hypothetical protein